ncbi:winged helix-turn-helix domain-containing protein [Erythrobacter sp. GH1-10]|uniref:winged helix-turn-helix domain-containing protein n=1 Tax=Erythrobacter sp. GH1-10 TaxID=3349334 RepID=UPI003878323C
MSPLDHRNIDEVIHGRSRLAIMSFLYGAKQSDFVELKKVLELTDGNLGAQLKKLESKGYVKLIKGYLGRKTQMTITMTEEGRFAMQNYLKTMQALLDQ